MLFLVLLLAIAVVALAAYLAKLQYSGPPKDVVRNGQYVLMQDRNGNVGYVKEKFAHIYLKEQQRERNSGAVDVDPAWTYYRKGK